MALTQAAFIFGANSGTESTHPSLTSGDTVFTSSVDLNANITRDAAGGGR